MSIIDPPPSRVKEFIYIWKNWLNNLWAFLQDHTGGSSTGGTGTGSDWNAHGDTAVGAAGSPLKVTPGAFVVTGSTGNTPTDIETSGTHFSFIPAQGAIRAGNVSGTQWAAGNIGLCSVGMGINPTASNFFSVAIGSNVTSSAQSGIALGSNGTTASGTPSLALGDQCTAAGDKAVAIGSSCNSTVDNAISLGIVTTASGNLSTAIGTTVTASGATSTAIGATAIASGNSSLALGKWVKARNTNSVTIGIGTGSGTTLDNNSANTMWLGANTTSPTLVLQNSRCGIENQTPLSTLDVGGSVGYKYQIITSVQSPPATPLTLSDQLTVIVDNSAGPVSLNLPATSGVDRRIYHVKRAYSGGGAVKVYAANGEYIDGVLADSTTSGYAISAQDAPMILCDDTSTNKGWWIL